jgi:hypothetical protein
MSLASADRSLRNGSIRSPKFSNKEEIKQVPNYMNSEQDAKKLLMEELRKKITKTSLNGDIEEEDFDATSVDQNEII